MSSKISEQQLLNPKVWDVPNSCDNEKSKDGKYVCRQMPALWDLPTELPSSGRKLGCKSPRVVTNFRCKSRGGS